MLLAFGYGAKRKVRLSDALDAADAINHALPTQKEVEGAVSRLTRAGFLAAEGEFRVTREGRRLLRQVRGGSVFDEWKRLEGELTRRPLGR